MQEHGSGSSFICSSDEVLFYTEREDIPLWEAAIRYEESLTGESREEIWKRAEETLKTSYTSIEKGMTRGITFDGITTAKAANFLEKENSVPQINLGPARAGSLEALGIMEYSNAHGKIVCMPTGRCCRHYSGGNQKYSSWIKKKL